MHFPIAEDDLTPETLAVVFFNLAAVLEMHHPELTIMQIAQNYRLITMVGRGGVVGADLVPCDRYYHETLN